ncbi:vacuolar endopolyphosphatase [Coccidioides immitis RS]|uniref:Endopolyphosphatase n=3 Tax=Coccidioides immitis TaxID=5501 RepID=J3K9D7_COCIM|nr:vacuolar endopolyphosphatase [Coccidioides immitis RS]EAS31504.3 vacuolar endopolyphosphatase [Coccidioides immitis RS]KMP04143.1 endopolyphosphatase [Coccidioides immitis RMSCC 2394]TPX24277.1 Endopolyphosphatase [Coccidioides immitis]
MAKRPWILLLLAGWISGVTGQVQHPFQAGAEYSTEDDVLENSDTPRLHGRFLHITDIHPDSHYKAFSNSDSRHDCHRGKGDAGFLGSAGTDCDSPFTLVNATFKWIQENLRDSIDFVVWTGDSARHDNDENIPRSKTEIIALNQAMVDSLRDVFSETKKGKMHLRIPIVPTIGNNDVMPHNIFHAGPNRWTTTYARMWSEFIPEEQRHSFVQGGWFYVEVIPNKLAVFSLNTMYFFASNNAVDGCYDKSQPGYEHMEWLRIQLQFIRDRSMKAILIGHVPPARTSSKQNWDETCWQKYTLWVKQYRDVVVGSMFGHMNIDHFMFQDFRDLKIGDQAAALEPEYEADSRDKMTTQSRTSYLRDLRDLWAKLPSPPSKSANLRVLNRDKDILGATLRKSKKKYHRQIGGKWAERYAVSLVSPSVVPNYFPSLRIIEYNISGLDDSALWTHRNIKGAGDVSHAKLYETSSFGSTRESDVELSKKKRRKKKKKQKDGKKPPRFTIPLPPSRTAPPGPAYSNQPFTWLGYTQLFANITEMNSKFRMPPSSWREYRLQQAEWPWPSSTTGNTSLKFEVEYNTRIDKLFKLKDMTVKSYLKLARRIARSPDLAHIQKDCVTYDDLKGCEHRSPQDVTKSETESPALHSFEEGNGTTTISRRNIWKIFLRRAFVGYFDDDELRNLIARP